MELDHCRLGNAAAELFLKLTPAGIVTDTWLDETGYALRAMGVVLAIVFLIMGTRNPPPVESAAAEQGG